MNVEQTLEALKKINLTGHLQGTGDPRWKRIFVEDYLKTRIGRISIFEEKYSHVKWYGFESLPEGEINFFERIAYRWEYLLKHGEPLDEARFQELEKQAWQLANDRQASILAARKARPCNENGKRIRRAKLRPANPRKYLQELLDGSNETVQLKSASV